MSTARTGGISCVLKLITNYASTANPVLWVVCLMYGPLALGSVALGAFIVAVIQFIRILLEWLDRKTKEMQEKNVALKWVMCCVKTYVWLLEKIMQFINK